MKLRKNRMVVVAQSPDDVQAQVVLVAPIPPKGLRMKRFAFSTTSLIPALLYLPLQQVVHAYIDPGTGSIVIQAVIGAFAAVVVAIVMFWRQIKAFVRNLFSGSKKSEGPKEQ